MGSRDARPDGATPDAVKRRSVDEILRYRKESREAAERFREYLRRLEAQLTVDPWSDKFRERLTALIQTEVVPEIFRVREAKVQIWKNLFDETLSTTLSPRNVAAVAGALGLKLTYLPGMTYTDLIGIGGATLAAQLLPKLLTANQAEEEERRRNALFFILQLS